MTVRRIGQLDRAYASYSNRPTRGSGTDGGRLRVPPFYRLWPRQEIDIPRHVPCRLRYRPLPPPRLLRPSYRRDDRENIAESSPRVRRNQSR
jgi:hypothetical protein